MLHVFSCMQEELVQQGYLKPDPATLNLKAVAKAKKAGKKASKRADAGGGGESAATGFRCYTSPAGLQVCKDGEGLGRPWDGRMRA